MPHKKVAGGIHLVGGDSLTYADDCLVYLVDASPVVLIDAGANKAVNRLLDNVAENGLDP